MFYLKTQIDGQQKIVDIYNDEIYTQCFKCGTEFQVSEQTLSEIFKDGEGDLTSTNISCGCDTKLRLIHI